MTPSAARTLFMDYDGSSFYMSRDGVRAEYESHGVPKELEQDWLDELTTAYQIALDEEGNWKSVHFFWHHGDERHLQQVLDAEPLGEWWERCSYLEMTLRYIDLTCRGHYPGEELSAACHVIEEQGRRLQSLGTPEDQAPNRATRLISQAGDVGNSFTT